MDSESSGPKLTNTMPPAPAASDWTGLQRIAPPIHTIFLMLLLLAFSYFAAKSQHTFSRRHGPSPLYAMTIIWEWVLVGYVALGLRRQRIGMRELIGGRWRSVRDALDDAAVGVAFWVLAVIVLAVIGYMMGLANPREASAMRERIGFLVPHSRAELLLFIAVSATAGFCEEIIFRGHFMRQFAAATRSVWGGLVLQGALFGASHAYEGSKRMVLIAIYGMMFGALALARRSLRPGMLAHALQDASVGIALYFFIR